MIIAGIGSHGGIGQTTLLANLFVDLMAKKKNVYWLSLSHLLPPLLIRPDDKWLEFENIYREIPSWNKELCVFCDECQKVCSCGALSRYGDFFVVYSELCNSCAACIYACNHQGLKFGNKKIGFIEKKYNNPAILRVNLNNREIFGPWHLRKAIDLVIKKFPPDSYFLLDIPSGFRELWADMFDISDLVLFFTNDIIMWEMLYKSVTHDQATFLLVVKSDVYDAFSERGYSFALPVPYSRKISEEAIQGKPVSDKQYINVIDELFLSMNIEE
jgi:MinD superfamily P-loop ATPase